MSCFILCKEKKQKFVYLVWYKHLQMISLAIWIEVLTVSDVNFEVFDKFL